jgi:hypothetical protein
MYIYRRTVEHGEPLTFGSAIGLHASTAFYLPEGLFDPVYSKDFLPGMEV